MYNFDENIQDYKRYGTYNYKFDESGNVIFNSTSSNFNQVYISFPLQNIIYDNSKIEMMYNVNFEEFVPQFKLTSSINVDNLLQQFTVIQDENKSLKIQLDKIVSESEISSDVNNLATKQVILELRKLLGEGILDGDFSNTFPYTPIRKNI